MDAFDLRRFAPPATTAFTLRRHGDQVFTVDGDPDVDDVARMLRIENVVRGIDEGDSAAALVEGKALLLRMVQECQPEVTEILIGPQELIVVFSLIVKGPTVAEAVMESITASNLAEAGAREQTDGAKREENGPGGAETVAPLVSAKVSSAASSSSDEPNGSLLATGTG